MLCDRVHEAISAQVAGDLAIAFAVGAFRPAQSTGLAWPSGTAAASLGGGDAAGAGGPDAAARADGKAA